MSVSRRPADNTQLARSSNWDWDWGLDTFRRRLDNLERSMFSDFGQLSRTQDMESMMISPKVDLKETNDKFEIVAEMPGLDKKDIKIDLDEERRMLTLKGERKAEREERRENEKFYYKERSFGSFQRSFRLPENIKMDQVKASMNQGLLKIDIPKSMEQQRRMRSIQVGDMSGERSNA